MTCAYCGIPLKKGTATPANDALSKDHIIPKHLIGQGGLPPRLNKLNIIACCHGCNQDKGGLSWVEYRLIVAFRAGMHIEMPMLLFANETMDEFLIEQLLLEALA